MIKRISINDANDVRNARDHMKKIRDGVSAGNISVSFDFRNAGSTNLMMFSSIEEDGKIHCRSYMTGGSEAGFLVPVKADYLITAFDKMISEKHYASATYAV